MLNETQLKKRLSAVLMVTLLIFLLPLAASAAKGAAVEKAHAQVAAAQIDINKADSLQLSALPGIGPEIAGRIVSYRSEHGLFKSTQDLQNVKGVGEKKLVRISDLITVGPQK